MRDEFKCISKSAFGDTFAFCNLCHCDVNIDCRENAYCFSLFLDHRISLFLVSRGWQPSYCTSWLASHCLSISRFHRLLSARCFLCVPAAVKDHHTENPKVFGWWHFYATLSKAVRFVLFCKFQTVWWLITRVLQVLSVLWHCRLSDISHQQTLYIISSHLDIVCHTLLKLVPAAFKL